MLPRGAGGAGAASVVNSLHRSPGQENLHNSSIDRTRPGLSLIWFETIIEVSAARCGFSTSCRVGRDRGSFEHVHNRAIVYLLQKVW